MPSPVPNTSALWGQVFARTLARLATENNAAPLHAFISPGSRSTPLTAALAATPAIQAIPVLDERTAAFLAVGTAAARRTPSILVCTSGTATANYLPAIVEAWHSQVPLIIATADRPAELRGRGAGQTIEQNNLYGVYTVFASEAPQPSAAPDALAAWEETIRAAWTAATGTSASGDEPQAASGPAHINIPLNEPLAPASIEPGFALSAQAADFLENLGARRRGTPPKTAPLAMDEILDWASAHANGIIVAGAPAAPRDQARTAETALALANRLGWPLLADALHPARHRASPARQPAVIAAYDAILRDPARAAALRPAAVIQLDQLPTSKVLRQWLAATAAPTLQISHAGHDLNPLHRNHRILPRSIADFAPPTSASAAIATPPEYLARWLRLEHAAAGRLAAAIADSPAPPLFEGEIIQTLARILPDDAVILFANSMSVRDAEYFWPATNTRRRIHCNRGANGIDGTLGTALGLAFAPASPPVFLLTGDLAFLHDSNALACARHLPPGASLTAILVNNDGGGIFDTLPVSRNNPDFERFWATPQHVDFASLCAAHAVPHVRVETTAALSALLAAPPPSGLRVLELRTNRAHSATLRTHLLTP